MRFLSILFNPIGHLIWWIFRSLGGGIDRRLGQGTGWVLAWALVLLWALSLAAAIYGTRDNILKLAGLRERSPVTLTGARVISAETIRRKTLTIEQSIVAEYAGDDGAQRIDGRVTEPVSKEYAPGDVIPVYVSGDGAASFRNPEDPFFDAVLALAGTGIPLIALGFSLKYLRHRNRLRPRREAIQARPVSQEAETPQLARGNDVVVRGRQRVKTHEERRKDEIEMIRRMHEKANQLKKN
jgi:hypothetical protein